MNGWPNTAGWVGLDIGGANLKIAGADRFAVQRSFAVWREAAELSRNVAELLASAPSRDRVALTMTAELADCFPNRTEGVLFVLDAVRNAAGAAEVLVYSTDGGGCLSTFDAARQEPTPIAAANWLAIANWVARAWSVQRGMLVDLGSTTTDIVLLAGQAASPVGLTDAARLASGELVYTGLLRTPVAAILDRLACGGQLRRIAAEWFAHASDAQLILGDLPESEECGTADGRPFDREYAKARLARCVCLDAAEWSDSDAELAAGQIVRAQLRVVEDAIAQVASRWNQSLERVVVSGAGWRMAATASKTVLPHAAVDAVADQLGEAGATCAAALAVAALAAQS